MLTDLHRVNKCLLCIGVDRHRVVGSTNGNTDLAALELSGLDISLELGHGLNWRVVNIDKLR